MKHQYHQIRLRVLALVNLAYVADFEGSMLIDTNVLFALSVCSPEIFDYIYSHDVNPWKAKIWSVERTEGEIHRKAQNTG